MLEKVWQWMPAILAIAVTNILTVIFIHLFPELFVESSALEVGVVAFSYALATILLSWILLLLQNVVMEL